MMASYKSVAWIIALAAFGSSVRADVRNRSCSAPATMGCRKKISETRKRQSRNAQGSNSAWGEWSEWSTCNVSCESGYATRVRDCLKADACFGMSMSTEHCEVPRYCKPGGWAAWSSWQTIKGCSVTCGEGFVTMTRLRSCNDQRRGCPGDGTVYTGVPCSAEPCYVNGSWGLWSSWIAGSCSVSCSYGTRLMVRRRMCDSPPPSGGGEECEGPSNITYVQNCKVAVPCGVAPAYSSLHFENPSSAYNNVAFPTVLSVIVGVPLVISVLCIASGILTTVYCARRRRSKRAAAAESSAAIGAAAAASGCDAKPEAAKSSGVENIPNGYIATATNRRPAATAASVTDADSSCGEADLTLTYVVTRPKSVDFGVRIVSGSL